MTEQEQHERRSINTAHREAYARALADPTVHKPRLITTRTIRPKVHGAGARGSKQHGSRAAGARKQQPGPPGALRQGAGGPTCPQAGANHDREDPPKRPWGGGDRLVKLLPCGVNHPNRSKHVKAPAAW